MSSGEDGKFDSVMKDVRTAYRLLHDYQRMVLDLVDYMGKRLGFGHPEWYPKFSAGVRPTRPVDPKRWAWDWLGMIASEFHFRSPLKDNKSLILRCSVVVYSDTGFYLSESTSGRKTDVSRFQPVGDSHTILGLMTSVSGWAGPPEVPEEVRDFVTHGVLPKRLTDVGVVGYSVPLAAFRRKTDVDGQLDRLVRLATDNGIPLSLIGKT